MNTNAFVTNATFHGALKSSAHLYKIWDKACAT